MTMHGGEPFRDVGDNRDVGCLSEDGGEVGASRRDWSRFAGHEIANGRYGASRGERRRGRRGQRGWRTRRQAPSAKLFGYRWVRLTVVELGGDFHDGAVVHVLVGW